MSTADPRRPASSTFRTGVLAILLALALAAAGVLVWLAADRGEGGPVERFTTVFSASEGLQPERDAVMKQARDFMTRVNTYGPDLLDEQGRMPDYREGIAELTTAKFGADFEQNAPLAEATVQQAGLARSTQVYSTGVAALEADRAVVMVAGEFTNSYPAEEGSQERVSSDPQPYRVNVTLVRTEGRWLVDAFEPVAAGAGEGEQ